MKHSDIIVQADKLSKIYPLYKRKYHRILELIHPFRKKYHQDFYALDSVSFQVKRGETIGIIGQNGSGKSTLLKVITGVTYPEYGSIFVNGSISSLLELGAGFNGEMTGIENIYFQGLIHGLSKKFMDSKLDEIVSFADIGEYIHQPVRTYSSGMFVRLAFSCAVHTEPELLIVDEALSVGDAYFQVKSINKMRHLIQSGCTVLFVSHDGAVVKNLCNKAILLDHGKLIYYGDPYDTFNYYSSLISLKSSNEDVSVQKIELIQRTGNKKIEIINVYILNQHGNHSDKFISGENVQIVLEIKANETVENPTFGIGIRDRIGNDIFGINNLTIGQSSRIFQKDETAKIVYQFPLNIGENIYGLQVAAHLGFTHLDECFDWINDVLVFSVVHNKDFTFVGTARIPASFRIE